MARKFIHILAGSFIAFLPFWIDYSWIIVMAIGFVAVNLANRYRHFFHAVYKVKRNSWGEVLFSIAVLICALIGPSPWIFAAAILHVSLADGLAAVTGIYLGHHHGVFYRVWKHHKTAIGTAVFTLLSFFIVALTLMTDSGFASINHIWPVLIWLPVLTTAVENLGVHGLDNLFLPLVVVAALTPLQY
jgi:dolichol kinase